MRIADLDHFFNYVFRILSEPPSARGMDDGMLAVYETRPQGTVLSKVFALIQAMVDRGLTMKKLFHTLVRLKSLYHGGTKRFCSLGEDFDEEEDFHDYVDDAIRTILGDEEKDDDDDEEEDEITRCGRSGSGEKDSGDSTQHELFLEESGRVLSWVSPPAPPCFEFWDFAAAARNLRSGHPVEMCSGTTCIHENNLYLQDWLQKKAWTEIRTKDSPHYWHTSFGRARGQGCRLCPRS